MTRVQHYLLGAETAARHRPGKPRPVKRLVEALRIRVAAGEDARAVLEGAGVTNPPTVALYLTAAGLDA